VLKGVPRLTVTNVSVSTNSHLDGLLEIHLDRAPSDSNADSFKVELRFDDLSSQGRNEPVSGPVALSPEELRLYQSKPRIYGEKLSDGLFGDELIRSTFRSSKATVEARGGRLRISLVIQPAAPQLHALAWELLTDPDTKARLSTSEATPFSRFLFGRDWTSIPLLRKSELKALIAVPNPSNLEEWGLTPIDAAAEILRAREAMEGIQVTVLDGPVTLETLVDAIRQGFDLLYLVCHGSLRAPENRAIRTSTEDFESGFGEDVEVTGKQGIKVPVLFMEQDQTREVVGVSGGRFARRLADLGPGPLPRLIVLASCESAGADDDWTGQSAQASLAPRLARAGVPALIAMQGKISVETTRQFMKPFFARLVEHGSIDQAMAAARGKVRDRPDCWMPALFLRLKDGRIWHEPGVAPDRDIIRQFGLNTAPASFKARIKGFVDYYLGSDDAPTPFGGRGPLIDNLNAWLADPKAPRNMLVSAPAGRGKSALLVRWLKQLGDEWPVCFIPISVRYATNQAAVFYPALAARLASILGETLPQTPSDPGIFYQEKVIEYLDQFNQPGRRCLIVIDGLDEAAGWKLDTTVLPARPPEGIRIVATARQLAGDRGAGDWLRRLGWGAPRGTARTLEVPPLTTGGIADVLHNMGFPLRELSTDVDVIAELFRLTEHGDPLMLEFYVYDLRKSGSDAARLRPQDLADLKPGFAAYFEEWFEQQRKISQAENRDFDEQVVKASLAVLSCAHGPIALDSLSPAVQVLLGSKLLISKESLRPISRFVIGDGVASGLVFAHPRLAIFIQEDYFGHSGAVDDARRAIAEWGRTIVDALNRGVLAPEKAPDYALRYYVQHLEELPDIPPTVYRELVENGWISAWLARGEGMRGFGRDVGIVLTKLRKAAERDPSVLAQPKVGLGGQVRCALCLSSIRSIGGSVPPNFLVALVRQDLLSPRQALHFARLKVESGQTLVLEGLASLLGGDILDEAIEDARAIAGPSYQSAALAALAAQSTEPSRTGLFKEARESAERCDREYERDTALRKIEALQASLSVDPAAAEKHSPGPPIVPETLDEPEPPRQLDHPSSDRPSDVEVRAQFEEIVKRYYPWIPPRDLAQIAPFLPPDLLTESLQMVLTGEAFWRAGSLRLLAPYLNSSQLNLAVEFTLALSEPYYLNQSLRELGPFLPPDVPIANLQMILDRDAPYRADNLQILAPHLNFVQLGLALESTLGLSDSYKVSQSLSALAPFLTPDLLTLSLRQVLESKDLWRDANLRVLAPHLNSGQINLALESTLALTESYQLSRSLSALSPFLSEPVREQVIEEISRLKDDHLRASALASLIPDLPGFLHERALNILLSSEGGEGLGRLLVVASPELFERIVDMLPSMENYVRQRALETAAPDLRPDSLKMLIDAVSDNMADFDAILPFVPEKDRAGAVARAYKTAFRIADSLAVAAALTALAARLPENDARQAASRARTLAQQIPGDQERAFACLLVTFSDLIATVGKRELFLEARRIASGAMEQTAKLFLEAALFLSPVITAEELDESLPTLAAKLEPPTDQDEAMAIRILLAFAPSLPESRRSEILKVAVERLEGVEKDPEIGFALASLVPWLPKPIALSYVGRSFSKANGQELAASLASLSPSLTAEEALSYAEKGLAIDEFAAESGALIAPYLPEPEMKRALGKVLDKASRSTRAELLTGIAIAEGHWLEMLGIHPALGGAGRRSCLETLGGPHAIPEVYAAICDVVKWWP